MSTTPEPSAAIEIKQERKLKRELTLLPLVGIIYFTVCGGTFGIEPLIGYDGSGPGLGDPDALHHSVHLLGAHHADGQGDDTR